MRYEIRNLVTCKYLRSPAVLQVFCNFSSFSLNLGGSYVYESVIIVHKSLSLVDTVARKSQAIKIFSIQLLIRR